MRGGLLSTLNLPSKTPPVSGGQREKIWTRNNDKDFTIVSLYIAENYAAGFCF